MAEPTLLQQARERLEMGKAAPASVQAAHVGIAVEHVVRYLLQHEAAMREPAQVPAEPKCKVCGETTDKLVHHGYYSRHHDFEPETPPAPSTALDLDKLQRLCDAATPGPWKMDDEGDLRAVCAGYDESRGLMQLVRLYAPVALATERPEWESHPPDVAFVAAARDALPKLIAKVRELEAKLDGK